MRNTFFVFILSLFFLPQLYSMTNARPEFEDEIDLTQVNSSQSILFDNYEEVFIKNYEKEKLTEIHFLGNVKIRFQNNTLIARKVVVTARGNKVLEISAFDNVEFHYGSDIYLSRSLIFEPEKKRGVLKQVRSYMGGGQSIGPMSSSSGWYYSAETATILDQDRVVLDNAFFTTSDELVPHYGFYAGKLWYFKNEIVYALNLTYSVGQADFLPVPFFLRWEKGTGIETAFAQEKRIGWYMMNSYSYRAPYGSYNFGLDLYERLGEYAFVKFNTTKPLSNITKINAEIEIADDVRLLSDPANYNRYSQLIDVNGDGIYSAIRQFSWRYKLNVDFKTSDLGVNLYWEDMNDPNFSLKYNQSRQNNFDIQKLLQPEENYFYTRNDSSLLSTGQTVKRGFSLNAGKFSLNGAWTYKRYVANETNQYLNDRYDYFIYSRSLPNLSYSPSALTILKSVQFRTPQSFSVTVSNTNLTFENSTELGNYIIEWQLANGVDTHLVETNDINAIVSNQADTNMQVEPISISNTNSISNNKTGPPKPTSPRIVTNYYVFYDVSSQASARLNLTASETLETNGDVVSDQYVHTESGNVTLNGAFLNRLLNWNNTLTFSNTKRWTSLGTNYNDTFNSGINMALSSSLGMTKTLTAWKERAYQLDVPLSLSHAINYQIYKTISVTKPRESSHSTSLRTGFNMFKKQLDWNLTLGHSMRYRLTNGIEDIYLDNKLDQRLTASTGFKVWWVSASTSMSLDLLETKSNALELDYQDFTNRLSGHPRLTMALTVPNNYLSATYVYDLIDATNISLGASTRFSLKNLKVPLFYELTALSMNAAFNYDFLQQSSSIFTLSFSVDLRITKYWRLNFNTSVRNKELYRYFEQDATKLPVGVTPLNFWEDLGDSLSIWDYEALKRGSFKIQGLHFNLSHDLDEWILNIQFNVNRRIDTVRMFAYWEPAIRIEFKLNGSSDQFPPYEQKFVPEEYQ